MHIKTSVYHPQTNDSLKIFPRCLKGLSWCLESEAPLSSYREEALYKCSV